MTLSASCQENNNTAIRAANLQELVRLAASRMSRTARAVSVIERSWQRKRVSLADCQGVVDSAKNRQSQPFSAFYILP
ncbi:hypothetical protein Q1695_010732 [Nippostrongylus brasiliensis]|nr:hypothetical protein Q1695_010732 [Nippostrongylus brasiliensis]